MGQIERGFFGDGGALGGGMGDFERREVTVQTADGTTANRVEQGTVTTATDTALEFTLGSGEAVSVVIDGDTQAFELSQQSVEVGRRGLARERMVPSEIEVAAIAPGAEVVVWSDSADGADFVAQRIVVQPVANATTDTDTNASPAPVSDGSADAGAVPSAPAADA